MLTSTVFVAFIVGSVLSTPLPPSPTAKEAELQVLQGNNRLTTNLYKVLAEDNTNNVFFSPISVHVALSMAYQGAQGTTAQSLAETLQIPEPQVAADGYHAVMNRLNSVENITLAMANRVYLMKGAKLVDSFQSAVTNKFLSEVQLLDFTDSEGSAKIINEWVEEQTHEKIKGLISKDDLDALTRLVLVNAIYFKGSWKYRFDERRTKTEAFYLNDVDAVDVKMMHVYSYFNYKNDDILDAQILQMPYSNGEFSMTIILPNKKNGIKELEEKLEQTNLAEISQGMRVTSVSVSLPRFKSEQSIDLEDALTKLGLGEMFDENKANFRGMVELENLFVSKAIQKAFIEVNEQGAEAAAATALVFRLRSARKQVPGPNFRADHPFVYLISGKTSTHLFMGRLSNPNL